MTERHRDRETDREKRQRKVTEKSDRETEAERQRDKLTEKQSE